MAAIIHFQYSLFYYFFMSVNPRTKRALTRTFEHLFSKKTVFLVHLINPYYRISNIPCPIGCLNFFYDRAMIMGMPVSINHFLSNNNSKLKIRWTALWFRCKFVISLSSVVFRISKFTLSSSMFRTLLLQDSRWRAFNNILGTLVHQKLFYRIKIT